MEQNSGARVPLQRDYVIPQGPLGVFVSCLFLKTLPQTRTNEGDLLMFFHAIC